MIKLLFFIAIRDSCQVIIDTKQQKGLIERDLAPLVLLGEELHDLIS